VQIINDRGIAICKSMLAWQKFGEGKTPQNTGIKGDHFVGDFYVLFENKFQEEYQSWQTTNDANELLKSKKISEDKVSEFFKGYKNQYFNENSTLGKEARELLLKWEAGDDEAVNLWKMMNGWVYEGFDTTYNALEVNFHKNYYESDTYLLGKNAVEVGLERGVFVKENDGSVWCDMTDIGMDRKIVLRSDGTSVYITQDLGTAMKRYEDFGTEKMIYTVADEQDYHFKVLFEILKRLKEPYATGLYHLSYGMIDLTTGKMKSREGNVVDADDLINEVIQTASANAQERGELNELSNEQQKEIVRKIAMSALKFFIIKVQPKKRMTFNPEESLDMQGQTGPYVLNAYVRVSSLFRKGGNEINLHNHLRPNNIETIEKDIIKLILSYPDKIKEAADQYDPSTIANYCYALAKDFHRYWHEVRILSADNIQDKEFRLVLSYLTGQILKSGMNLLGIEMVDRM
jgi:arginyl-tRNA synthetase